MTKIGLSNENRKIKVSTFIRPYQIKVKQEKDLDTLCSIAKAKVLTNTIQALDDLQLISIVLELRNYITTTLVI